jgi:N-glycosylase/DNA lyase
MKTFKFNRLPTAKASKSEDGLPILIIEDQANYSVEQTFDCGQCFRFERYLPSKYEYEVHGVAHGKYLRVAKQGNTLIVTNATLEDYQSYLGSYLGLDYDWDAIKDDILTRCPDSKGLADAAEIASGIRILKQEPWETVASFIISQNNNIPRIKKTVETFCRLYGDRISVGDMEFFAFPTPQATLSAGIEGLAPLRAGYRDKYLVSCAQRFADGYTLPSPEGPEECIKELCKLHGVGPKVASCIALFTLNRLDSFPVDVWMKRAIKLYFPEGFDHKTLGSYAGVAQQYLFYYERTVQSGARKERP